MTYVSSYLGVLLESIGLGSEYLHRHHQSGGTESLFLVLLREYLGVVAWGSGRVEQVSAGTLRRA